MQGSEHNEKATHDGKGEQYKGEENMRNRWKHSETQGENERSR